MGPATRVAGRDNHDDGDAMTEGDAPVPAWCEGKEKFIDRRAAIGRMRLMQRREARGLDGLEETHLLRSYRCEVCGFYHLGRRRGMPWEHGPREIRT